MHLGARCSEPNSTYCTVLTEELAQGCVKKQPKGKIFASITKLPLQLIWDVLQKPQHTGKALNELE